MTHPFAPLLLQTIAIAQAAGRAILTHYEAGTAVETKQDGSPVTAADRASEEEIIAGLQSLAPEIPILSEEQASIGVIPDLSGGTYWCVDPLDGTKEFVRRTGEFTVCIAGIADGRPVLGVLHAPVLGLTYAAVGPDTAIAVAPDGTARPIAVRRMPEGSRIALVSRSHRDGADLDSFLAEAGVGAQRSMGSAIKFGLIAAGEADLYARFGPTCEWDTAAGQAVLEAAGGTVRGPDGSPLAYGKTGFLNPGFVASA